MDFWKKLTSPIVYWNLIMLVLVSIVLLIVLWFWMKDYSHHGERVEVPQTKGMLLADAEYELEKQGLVVVISDSSYNRNLPAGTVLEMTPAAGSKVKTGRNIYLTINTRNVPTLPIPDIADNCSLREAEARLKSLGFKLGTIEYAPNLPWAHNGVVPLAKMFSERLNNIPVGMTNDGMTSVMTKSHYLLMKNKR